MVATTTESVASAAGVQALIVPPSVAKMNRAEPVPSEPVTGKLVVVFATCPVGGPPLMLTTSGTIAGGTAGGAPENSVAVLVPWLDVHSGLVGRNDMPQGLTRSGSVSVAMPGMSETMFVWTTRVPEPGPLLSPGPGAPHAACADPTKPIVVSAASAATVRRACTVPPRRWWDVFGPTPPRTHG